MIVVADDEVDEDEDPRLWVDEPGCLRRMMRRLVEERSPGDARHVGDFGDGRRAKGYPQKILLVRRAARTGSTFVRSRNPWN